MSILNTLYNIAHSTEFPNFDELDDLVDDDDCAGVVRANRAMSYDSIAKQSKNGVMQFPFICSRSLSFDNIQMVAKAGERNFANLLQVIFTMNQITTADQPQDFVRQFHQNMKTSVDGPSDVVSFIFNSAIPRSVQNEIMKQVQEGNVTFESMFELNSLNSKYIPKDMKLQISHVMEASRGSGRRASSRTRTISSSFGGGNRKPPYDPYQIARDNLPTNVFVDSDVKKANELMPTLMHVRMRRERGINGENSQYVDFIVGLKATVHAIDSADMVDHLVGVFQERGKLFKLIQWTTGELSFFRDLVFNIDQIKGEIKGTRSGKASVWWTALKNAKAKRKMHHYTRRDPILPNASIVISMDEVDYIKANYGFDIMEDENGKKIIDQLNILSFYVVDPGSEVVYTFLDGQDHYEITTFRGLERDNGSTERQFKDVLKAVNKLQ